MSPPTCLPGRTIAWLAASLLACGGAPVAPRRPAVSSTLALASDERTLWVVNPDADSVSVLDVSERRLVAEVLLAPAHPEVDPLTRRYEPRVKPRALALAADGGRVYVAGQSANRLFTLDAAGRSVTGSVEVGAEPVSVVAAADGGAVYVVSHQAATVSRVDPGGARVVATLPLGPHPWGASLSADGRELYVTHLLLGAGVTVIDTAAFTVRAVLRLADQPADAAGGKLVPNGVPRGAYQAVPRPAGDGELWVPHLLLAVATPQPALDFQSTVFPTISRVDVGAAAGGAGLRESSRLLLRPLDVPGARGAFDDVISGPRALAFTPDGALALLVDSGSEDVMVFDAEAGQERALLRPLPAGFPEGIALDRAGRRAFVDGRNSHDVTVLRLDPSDPIAPLRVDGAAIDRLARDPMPEALRLGQRLFYTANSSRYPITRNFWVSCSSCHIEGGSDAVTWLFAQGPRDTPSNAGGPLNTGFLLRQGFRNDVTQYDATINLEQGGRFDRASPAQRPLLDALAAFVNLAIPLPQNPHRPAGAALGEAQARGAATFEKVCASCHPGAFYTDSGAGNPSLDLAGPIRLHDVGTCVRGGPHPDRPAADEVTGRIHGACEFDTPTLRGIFASAPYFHDGSAATLRDVVDRLESSAALGAGEKADLVEFLETL